MQRCQAKSRYGPASINPDIGKCSASKTLSGFRKQRSNASASRSLLGVSTGGLQAYELAQGYPVSVERIAFELLARV